MTFLHHSKARIAEKLSSQRLQNIIWLINGDSLFFDWWFFDESLIFTQRNIVDFLWEKYWKHGWKIYAAAKIHECLLPSIFLGCIFNAIDDNTFESIMSWMTSWLGFFQETVRKCTKMYEKLTDKQPHWKHSGSASADKKTIEALHITFYRKYYKLQELGGPQWYSMNSKFLPKVDNRPQLILRSRGYTKC